MPSVNPKLEKQASTEAVDPIRQAIIVLEHKIRNLEKRKGKLESYRDIVKNGGELNADQKTAVAKYDEVQQTLEITRDLYKQIVGIANDAAKQQKKLARKEALERMQQDIAKVREVLLIQDTLMNMGEQNVRDDFLNGTNGAVKLLAEDIKYLDELYNEVMLKHNRPTPNEPTFVQQVQKVAEHYVLIVDGKQREVVGTTYSKLKEIITSINQSGYFDQANSAAAASQEVDEVLSQKVADSNITESKDQIPEQINLEGGFNDIEKEVSSKEFTQPHTETLPAAVPVTLPLSGIPVLSAPFPPMAVTEDPFINVFPLTSMPHIHQPQQPLQQQPIPPQQQHPQQPQAQPTPAQAPRLNDVIGPAPNFCFLQDSELDQPETTAASQTPVVVSHIPTAATVVAAAVTLNAPIPTQTFTNQTFVAPHVVPTPVMYPSQDISHLPTFGNANPPPPIPMPPSHQTGIQFNQTPSGFPQQQTQTFEQMNQETLGLQKEEIHENLEKTGNEVGMGEGDVGQSTSTLDWGDATENVGDWSQEQTQSSGQDSQKSQQAWGDQSRNFRGRGGGRRGNSNGYGNRPRGNYQQNGRSSYYRSNDGGSGGNYQNGYQRNWNSNNGEGGNNGGGYNSGFKRSASNQSRPTGPRSGDRSNMDRTGGPRGGGSQFRGPQRGGNRPNYAPRGNKTQTQN